MSNNLRYDGRVAIVTGGGQGIGKQYALFFSGRGASVLINDLGKDKNGNSTAQIVADQIIKNGGKAAANKDSVDQGEKIVKQCIDTFGRVDIIVNNAGILRDVSFGKMKESDWDMIMKVHLKGSFSVTRAAWPHLRKQGYGRIINTGSTAGLYGNFGQVNYSAAKLGLHGFTRALHKEGNSKNILTNTIVPMAATAMTETVMSKEILKALDPYNVVPFVAYLCHESNKKSGCVFECGAGFIAQLRWQRAEGAWLKTPLQIEDVAKSMDKVTNFKGNVDYPEESSDTLTKMIKNYERVHGELGSQKSGNFGLGLIQGQSKVLPSL